MVAPASPHTSPVHCIRCGYTLAAPARDATCSECGAPVSHSLDAPFDARVRRWMHAGAVGVLTVVTAQSALQVVLSLSLFRLPPSVAGTLFYGLGIAQCLAIWMVTTPLRPMVEPQRRRQAVRVLAAMFLALLLSRFSAAGFPGVRTVQRLWRDAPTEFGLIVGSVILILLGAATIPRLWRVMRLRQVGQIMRTRRALSIVAIGCGVILASWLFDSPSFGRQEPAAFILVFTLLANTLLVALAYWLMQFAAILRSPTLRRAALAVCIVAAFLAIARMSMTSFLLWMLENERSSLTPELISTFSILSTISSLLSSAATAVLMIVMPRAIARSTAR